MTWIEQCLQKIPHFCLLPGILMGLTTSNQLVRATPTVSSEISASTHVHLDPPNNGAPGTQRSDTTSSRPSCPAEARLVSLSPITNWGETLENKPSFFIYSSTNIVIIEFSLTDESSLEKVYTDLVYVDPRSGIFKFTLPNKAPELEVDRLYRWQFQVACNSLASPDKEGLQVNGIIVRRSNADLQTKIESASPREKVELYAENGFWFDTLNELLKLRCAAPENPDLKVDWASLLEHPIVQLNDLVEEPINPICLN